MQVNLDVGVIQNAAIEAFQETCFLLGREFTQVISEVGAFDAFPNSDIVDSGALRASQQLDFISPTEAQFSWGTAYSIYVHEGYTLRNGKQQPGRPWTKLALDRLDPQATFNTLLESKL